ncbi:MAG: Ig-like domain-containing protein, partial [Pseudomonadota bacterium]
DAGANPGNLVTDQRGAGFARNSGPDFDIGAVEQQAIEKQAPVFLGDLSDRSASVTLPENSAAGTSVFDVDANDNNGGGPDANVTYRIVGGNISQDGDADLPFAIDSATGVITVNDAGDLDFETTPLFRLTVEADNGTTTANALVTVSLSDIDESAPVIAAQTFSFAENQSEGATLATVVATDDVAVTGFSILSGDPNDFFDIDANGVLTLTNAGVASAANDFETQPNAFSLTVQASDAAGKTTNGLMTLNVTDVLENTPPIANLDVLATDEDTVLSGNVLLDNGNGADSDVDGDALTVTAVNGEAANVGSQITLASGALLTVNADGTLSYDPNGQFESLTLSGRDTEIATYTISDGNGGSAIGNVEIRVDGINDAAVFSGDLSGSVTEDAVPNTASGTLAVTDVDGQSMVTAQTDTLGTYGSFTIDAAGAWTYTLDNADPDTDALASGDVGMDDFVVAAADGTQQTISIAINGADDAIVPPLTAVDDTFQVFEDIVFSGNVLANDVGPDLDALRSVRINDQTLPGGRALTEIALANGTLAINRLGDFTYTPNAEFNGADTFSYVLRDGSGATETASVNLVVTKVEDAPVAQDDMFNTDQGQSVSGNLLADNGNGIDSDADDTSGDTLRVVTADGTAVVSAGTELSLSGGTLVVDRLGDFTYTPDAGFSGVETFTYGLAQAGGVGRDTATVTIDVAPVANQLVEGRAIKLDFRNKEGILNEKADADGRANGLTFTNLERGAEVSGEGVLDRLGGNGLSVFELDSFGPNGSGPPVRVHIDDGIGIGRDRVVDEDETLSIGLTVDQANGGTFQFTKANASNRDGDFDPGETIDIHLLLDGVQVFQASYTHDPQARNSLQTLSLNELPSFHDTIVFDEAQLSAGTDETEFALRDIVFFTVVSELDLA